MEEISKNGFVCQKGSEDRLMVFVTFRVHAVAKVAKIDCCKLTSKYRPFPWYILRVFSSYGFLRSFCNGCKTMVTYTDGRFEMGIVQNNKVVDASLLFQVVFNFSSIAPILSAGKGTS
jgi:hypothetical protein